VSYLYSGNANVLCQTLPDTVAVNGLVVLSTCPIGLYNPVLSLRIVQEQCKETSCRVP